MTSAYDQGEIPQVEMRHRLQIAREFAGLRRHELADRMEISRNSVINAETGRRQPRKLMLNAWALACGVPVSWIITGEAPEGGPDPTSGLGIIWDIKQAKLSKHSSRKRNLECRFGKETA